MEDFYGQIANANFLGDAQVQIVLLGFFGLLVGLIHHSKAFRRLLVGSRIRRELDLLFAAYGVPLLIVVMEIQRVRGGSRGGGLFRFLGIFLLVVIVVVIGVLALIAFLVYRFLIRRGRR